MLSHVVLTLCCTRGTDARAPQVMMPMILPEAGVPDGGELPPGVSETVPPNGQIIMFLALCF